MQRLLLASFLVIFCSSAFSQEIPEEEEQGGFKKDHLFTGGSISLAFGSNTFQVGLNPVFGYNVAKWLDAGVVINYNYAAYNDVYVYDPADKLHSSTYGAGAFTRIYPIRFLFAHAQFEHNFVREKLIPGDGGPKEINKVEANSLLVGAGFSSDRYPGSGRPFFYLALLFDVLDNRYSPYVYDDGGAIPILRAGIQVPLFQGKKGY